VNELTTHIKTIKFDSHELNSKQAKGYTKGSE